MEFNRITAAYGNGPKPLFAGVARPNFQQPTMTPSDWVQRSMEVKRDQVASGGFHSFCRNA